MYVCNIYSFHVRHCRHNITLLKWIAPQERRNLSTYESVKCPVLIQRRRFCLCEEEEEWDSFFFTCYIS